MKGETALKSDDYFRMRYLFPVLKNMRFLSTNGFMIFSELTELGIDIVSDNIAENASSSLFIVEHFLR